MTVFLTPDGAPFYGGTYFPPDNRYQGMPGFPQLLEALADAYKNSPQDVEHNARALKAALNASLSDRSNNTGAELSTALLDEAANRLNAQFDTREGGLGSAPKFPQAMALDFILRSYKRTGDQGLLSNLNLTLEKMALGGIYDHLGGGFHRYSTDAVWLVPHFEKMLYDNSQLSLLYLETWQATWYEFYLEIINEVLTYVTREMTHPEGGFYSTQDADSGGEEGKFFVWSKAEIVEALGEKEAARFCRYYNVSERGNWEGHNILNVKRSVFEVARELGISAEELEDSLKESTASLFALREKRIKPGRDEKILTSWNGQMLKAFAVAGRVLENNSYTTVAINNAKFVLKYLKKDGRLLRTFKDDEKGKQARLNAYLEDYAFFIDGLLALYEATFDLRWLEEAKALVDVMLEQFWDEEQQSFFDTSLDHEKLVTRPRSQMDNAIPSGNSVAVDVLLRLSLLTGDPEGRYRAPAVKTLETLGGLAARHPAGFGRLLGALDFYLSEPKEIVIVGEPDAVDTRELLNRIYKEYHPNKVVMLRQPDMREEEAARWPLLAGRSQLDGKATAYVCQNYACQRPVNTPEELSALLG
jgi:uncharacterized protein YyaL (SSP411 family)